MQKYLYLICSHKKKKLKKKSVTYIIYIIATIDLLCNASFWSNL